MAGFEDIFGQQNSYKAFKQAMKIHSAVEELQKKMKDDKKPEDKKGKKSDFTLVETWMLFLTTSMIFGPGYNFLMAWVNVHTLELYKAVITK